MAISRNLAGQIHAYNSQKVGAEFRSARCELSQVPRIPLRKGSATASNDVRSTGQTAMGAHVPNELTGSNRQTGLAAENGFEVPGHHDNCLGYLPAFNLGSKAKGPVSNG